MTKLFRQADGPDKGTFHFRFPFTLEDVTGHRDNTEDKSKWIKCPFKNQTILKKKKKRKKNKLDQLKRKVIR